MSGLTYNNLQIGDLVEISDSIYNYPFWNKKKTPPIGIVIDFLPSRTIIEKSIYEKKACSSTIIPDKIVVLCPIIGKVYVNPYSVTILSKVK